MITVRVLLFAVFREAVGRRSIEVAVPDGTTVQGLYRRLEDEYPALDALRAYTTFAVNREVADPSAQLHAGDEVAFLQPVSGGSHD